LDEEPDMPIRILPVNCGDTIFEEVILNKTTENSKSRSPKSRRGSPKEQEKSGLSDYRVVALEDNTILLRIPQTGWQKLKLDLEINN
jgi:hypothetical protein